MRGGSAGYQRGGGVTVRSGGSHARYGGMQFSAGGQSAYHSSRRFGGPDRSSRRYAYNLARGDNLSRRSNFRHGKHFQEHDFDVHRRRFRRFVGFGYYDDYGYYPGGCAWLHRRAVITRSPYWWNRYYACINYSY